MSVVFVTERPLDVSAAAKQMLIDFGPLATAIRSPWRYEERTERCSWFLDYPKRVLGIISDRHLDDCFLPREGRAPETLHAVVLAGWNKQRRSDKQYWIAKNSWGPEWGYSGFFYVSDYGDGGGLVDLRPKPDAFVDFNYEERFAVRIDECPTD